MKHHHPDITYDILMDAVERRETSLDNPGFCTKCGEESFDCEPDMRDGDCESCGAKGTVKSPEVLLGVI